MSHSLTGHLVADMLATPLGSLRTCAGRGKGKRETTDEQNRFGRVLDPASSSVSWGGRNGESVGRRVE